ncbi:hypothetical protein VTN77DRAFT_9098 [Rasamsonia byssochlamydoides]|uniref:uncharacterized protein n=1 Tax=Rasamsonia byssochlamydoides TaxID=89139 RepID=UPI0037444B1D
MTRRPLDGLFRRAVQCRDQSVVDRLLDRSHPNKMGELSEKVILVILRGDWLCFGSAPTGSEWQRRNATRDPRRFYEMRFIPE